MIPYLSASTRGVHDCVCRPLLHETLNAPAVQSNFLAFAGRVRSDMAKVLLTGPRIRARAFEIAAGCGRGFCNVAGAPSDGVCIRGEIVPVVREQCSWGEDSR